MKKKENRLFGFLMTLAVVGLFVTVAVVGLFGLPNGQAKTTSNTFGDPTPTPTPCPQQVIQGSLDPADPDFTRPDTFLQGETCSATEVHNYDTYEFFLPAAGTVTATTCGTTS